MPLVTRQYGPNAKNSKLSNFDMDSNLYYLQNVGVSALTFSNNTLTLTNPTGGSISTLINTVTGWTVNGDLTVTGNTSVKGVTATTISATTISATTISATTISATTYQNLPPATFTGGTVNGATNFTNGLSANTISATTYQNLPQDIFVTGGTYTNGEILFKNNAGGNFTVTGLPIGGAGGEIYYLNLSQTQTPYNEFSPIGTNLPEQVSAVTVNSGVTSTIASFLTPVGYPNTTTIPAGYWSFYIHGYKDTLSASFDAFCEVYIRTTGGTETLILTTEGSNVTATNPVVSMQLTDGYYSGSTIDSSDRILVKVLATNTGLQTNTVTFLTEGQQHYSYGITPFSNFNALTCETLSGCTTIVNLENNKINKSGDTMTGTLNVPTISATTITATTVSLNQPNGVVGVDVINSTEAMVQVQNSLTQFSIFGRATGETYFYSSSAIPIVFYTNGNNKRMTIDSNGNVGIGVTTPQTKLHVSGNTKLDGGVTATTVSANTVTVGNTSGTPSQAASFDSTGKLVAGLGQSTFTAFGSSTLTVTSGVTTFTVIPGLTQTITVPENCRVLITTDGGMNTTSTVATAISSVDIAIFIDGSFPTNGGYRRISAFNPSSTAINSTGVGWSLTTIQNLSAGSHTIDVRAVYVIGSNASVSSNNSNSRQGALYITIIKN